MGPEYMEESEKNYHVAGNGPTVGPCVGETCHKGLKGASHTVQGNVNQVNFPNGTPSDVDIGAPLE